VPLRQTVRPEEAVSKGALMLPDNVRVKALVMRTSMRHGVAPLMRAVLLAGLVALPAGPLVVRAQDGAPAPEARARAFVALMAGGEYAQAFETFTPQMRTAMPVDRLTATWNALTAQAGPFRRQAAASITPRGVLSVVVITCEFERATLEVQVTVNPANLVGGLAIRPAAQAVTYSPPAYANPGAYQESEITVGTERWPLPATLAMPAGRRPVPALVLVHGSGPGVLRCFGTTNARASTPTRCGTSPVSPSRTKRSTMQSPRCRRSEARQVWIPLERSCSDIALAGCSCRG